MADVSNAPPTEKEKHKKNKKRKHHEIAPASGFDGQDLLSPATKKQRVASTEEDAEVAASAAMGLTDDECSSSSSSTEKARATEQSAEQPKTTREKKKRKKKSSTNQDKEKRKKRKKNKTRQTTAAPAGTTTDASAAAPIVAEEAHTHDAVAVAAAELAQIAPGDTAQHHTMTLDPTTFVPINSPHPVQHHPGALSPEAVAMLGAPGVVLDAERDRKMKRYEDLLRNRAHEVLAPQVPGMMPMSPGVVIHHAAAGPGPQMVPSPPPPGLVTMSAVSPPPRSAGGRGSPLEYAAAAAGAPAVDEVPEPTWFADPERKGQYKKGRFTAKEDAILHQAILAYCERMGIEAGKENTLFSRENLRSGKYRGLWQELGRALPDRLLSSIYAHCQRKFARGTTKTGKWDDEEVEMLTHLVETIGRNWAKIGDQLGRLPGACRDKYREIQAVHKGRWTEEEVAKLKMLVESATASGNSPNTDSPIFWTTIADQMGTRSYSQCRHAWERVYNPKITKKAWTKDADLRLIDRIYAVVAMSEYESGAMGLGTATPGGIALSVNEINWKEVAKSTEWTQHQCYARWHYLKRYYCRGVEGAQLTLDQILQQIREGVMNREEAAPSDDGTPITTVASPSAATTTSTTSTSGVLETVSVIQTGTTEQTGPVGMEPYMMMQPHEMEIVHMNDSMVGPVTVASMEPAASSGQLVGHVHHQGMETEQEGDDESDGDSSGSDGEEDSDGESEDGESEGESEGGESERESEEESRGKEKKTKSKKSSSSSSNKQPSHS